MAVPCTEHIFLTGRKGVGKSTLLRAMLAGRRLGGFITMRATAVFDRPSIHLLRAADGQRPTVENLVCFCGERDTARFDRLGTAALAEHAGCDVIVMDELGPAEEAAKGFQAAVLAALDGDTPVRGVLQAADSAFLRRVAAHPRVRVITVTEENRDVLRRQLCDEAPKKDTKKAY